MNNINCEVVQDLIPIYIDNLASESSKKIIENHVKSCNGCKEYLIDYKEEIELNNIVEVEEDIDKKLIMEVKKEILKRESALVILVTLLAIYFTRGSLNIFVIPVISITAIAIYYLGKNIWLAPIIVCISKGLTEVAWLLNGNVTDKMIGLNFLHRLIDNHILSTIINVSVTVTIFTTVALIGSYVGYLIEYIFINKGGIKDGER